MNEDNLNKAKSNLEKAKELLNDKKLNNKNTKKVGHDKYSRSGKDNTKGVKIFRKGSTNGS